MYKFKYKAAHLFAYAAFDFLSTIGLKYPNKIRFTMHTSSKFKFF